MYPRHWVSTIVIMVLAVITFIVTGCSALNKDNEPKEMEALRCDFKAEGCECSFELRAHPDGILKKNTGTTYLNIK